MNESPKPGGCGLLLVALCTSLSTFAVACGDDQSDDRDLDGGRDAGGDARSGRGAGRGGAGGTGGTDDDGGAGDGGGGLAPTECRERAVSTAGAACIACVCEAGPDETVACGPDCWVLVACIQVECGGDGSDIPCITSMCGDFLVDDAAVQAIEFDPIIRMCMAPCVAPLLDAGLDQDGGG